MIDLALMERLAASLGDDALLVLLGDADQLPSVEAGAVFRDLAAAHPAVLRLTRSFRMDPARGEGRRILELASALRRGETTALGALVTARPGVEALAFSGTELVPAAARDDLLERWYAERIAAQSQAAGVYQLGEDGLFAEDEARLAALHRHFQSFRLLCLTHGRPTGVDACNAWLRRRHGEAGGLLPVGAPVIMLRNDYDRGLYNGDQGLVVRVREGAPPPPPMALFPVAGRWSAFDLDSLRDNIALAFAMTVHKAQGSEFDDVALVLPETPIPLLSRELLYTALSRSRRALIICGSPSVLAAGVARPLARLSGVGARLL
jgi:exodeoxyribonuclease V alpha subunit